MKTSLFIGVLTLYVFSIAFAQVPPSSYSLNFHFIPPLVSAPCTFATMWNPPNMTCAMCFCLNGRISRCVPQPGCNPFPNNATTTTTPGSIVVPGPSIPVLNPGSNSSNPVAVNVTSPQPGAPIPISSPGDNPPPTGANPLLPSGTNPSSPTGGNPVPPSGTNPALPPGADPTVPPVINPVNASTTTTASSATTGKRVQFRQPKLDQPFKKN